MSGVEVAGLALAALPFVVNQLDNYARGLETIKGLRQYRWELESYSTNLGAQYAIFLNSLEIFLQDLVDDHDERSELIQDPQGPAWKDATFQKAVSEKLGRDHQAFMGTIKVLCDLLGDLSQKLGHQPTVYAQAGSIKSIGTIKFRKIFLKAIYQDILKKIDKANQILKTLSDQSEQLKKTKSGSSRWRGGLNAYRERRHHARALYNIFVQGQCWKCSCRDHHTICLRLDTNHLSSSSGDTKCQGKDIRFPMMVSATQSDQPSKTSRQWHEVELQPELIKKTVSINVNEIQSSNPISSSSKGKRKVRFATMSSSSTTTCVEQVHKAAYEAPLIADLCSTLGALDIDASSKHQETVGYVLFKEHTSDERYDLRILCSFEQDIAMHSLKDILGGSLPLSTPTMCSQYELSRQDRLHLAVVLACGILQFHGTWLKQRWGTQDILFVQNAQHGYTTFEHPYVVWNVLGSSCAGRTSCITSDNMIQNQILLPLAVVLVELSLGKTISMLYQPEDKDPITAQSQINTATRLLRKVYQESGTGYGDVVKECLYWSRHKGECFEDLRFDESVFDSIVSPLLKDFDYFRGVTHAV